ncbi:MAG: hypothetical protein AB7V45_14970 [Candidatus Krumholzibacteriia bacterium]
MDFRGDRIHERVTAPADTVHTVRIELPPEHCTLVAVNDLPVLYRDVAVVMDARSIFTLTFENEVPLIPPTFLDPSGRELITLIDRSDITRRITDPDLLDRIAKVRRDLNRPGYDSLSEVHGIYGALVDLGLNHQVRVEQVWKPGGNYRISFRPQETITLSHSRNPQEHRAITGYRRTASTLEVLDIETGDSVGDYSFGDVDSTVPF